MTGFQTFYSKQGDVLVADGVVIQPRTGARIAVGGGVDLTGEAVLLGARSLTAAVSTAATTAVGGSGRNLFSTGLAAVAGMFSPTRPDTFVLGDFTLLKTGPSAATIKDATDTVVAELTTGGTAPVGSYVGTTYGRDTYNSGAAFTLVLVAEEGAPGAIPDVLVTISAGTAMGGVYTATDAANYVSAADSNWTLFLAADGSAELRYMGAAVAIRPDGVGHDPEGRFEAVSGAYFYNPLPASEDDAPGVATVNPFGILTIIYTWPATPDLDTTTRFLADEVGFPLDGSETAATYTTWSGDDQGPSGSETVIIDLAQAWEDGQISTVAEVLCHADWYPGASGMGLATLDVSYTIGSFAASLTISPGNVTPAASRVASLRIDAAGAVTNLTGPWRAHVTIIGRLPRVGFAYVKLTETAGVLTAAAGPFFATALPTPSGSDYFLPLAYCDGLKVQQYVSGAVTWDVPASGGGGAEVVTLTQAAYLALSAETQMDGRWYVVPKT